jgi:hypothetical protein
MEEFSTRQTAGSETDDANAHTRKVLEYDQLIETAAASPAYRSLLAQASQDFSAVDAEGLGPEY